MKKMLKSNKNGKITNAKNAKFLLRRFQPLDFQTKLFPAQIQDFMNKSTYIQKRHHVSPQC